jgi:hypothetical protein
LLRPDLPYYYHIGDGIPYRSSVGRAVGWHLWKIVATNGGVQLFIDQTQVYSHTGSFGFNYIQFYVSGAARGAYRSPERAPVQLEFVPAESPFRTRRIWPAGRPSLDRLAWSNPAPRLASMSRTIFAQRSYSDVISSGLSPRWTCCRKGCSIQFSTELRRFTKHSLTRMA